MKGLARIGDCATMEMASLPEQVDKETAKKWAGDKFDEAAFDQAAKDGTVSKMELLKFSVTSAQIDAFMEKVGSSLQALDQRQVVLEWSHKSVNVSDLSLIHI